MKLKADFHIHAKGDPRDRFIKHTPFDVIDRAKEKNFDVIAFTFHRKVFFSDELKEYAQSKGILVIPGVEIDIDFMHIVLLNPPVFDISGIKSFSDLKEFKNGADVLAIAPHPFFPGTSCLNSEFFQHEDLFDAVEINGVYLNWLNYNKNIKKLLTNDKFPIIGCSDTHFLSQLGLTYTLIEAEKNISSILEAIRKNRVEVVSEPLSIKNNGFITVGIFLVGGIIRETLALLKRGFSAFWGICTRPKK